MRNRFGKEIHGEFGMFTRLKGGGGGDPPSSRLKDTEYMKEIRSETYPYIENAMAGEGYGPKSLTNMRWNSMYEGLESSFETAGQDMQSQLNRVLKPGDERPREFMTKNLGRSYYAAKDTLARQKRSELVSDKQMGMGMAADAIGKEQRMSVSNANAYNATLQANAVDQRQFGTFGTNVAGGVGEGMMDAYFAKQMSGGATI